MHVLHAIDAVRLEAGGVVRAVLDLTAELARAGAQVTLLTGDATDAPPEWLDGAAGAPRVVTINRALNTLLRPKVAGPTIDELVAKADFVHLHTPWDPLNPSLAAAARKAGKPYAVSVHGMLDDWCMTGKALKKHVYLALFGRRLLEQATLVHYTTAGEADQSRRWAPRVTPFVQPLVIDTAPFREPIGNTLAREQYPAAFAEAGPRALFLGRVQAIKGLPTLLRAFERLDDLTPRPHLLIAGPAEEGHDEELRAVARRLGITDRVHLLGMVGPDAKRSLCEAADAFVLPSHHENFGLALVEAMLCGTPVLTSRCVGIHGEVERLGGTIVEHSVEGFATGLAALLADTARRREAAVASRRAVFEWLDPRTIVAGYLDAYARAVQS